MHPAPASISHSCVNHSLHPQSLEVLFVCDSNSSPDPSFWVYGVDSSLLFQIPSHLLDSMLEKLKAVFKENHLFLEGLSHRVIWDCCLKRALEIAEGSVSEREATATTREFGCHQKGIRDDWYYRMECDFRQKGLGPVDRKRLGTVGDVAWNTDIVRKCFGNGTGASLRDKWNDRRV